MDPADIVGHVGYAMLVVGNWMIGNKQIWGFAWYFVANVIWLCIGWHIGMTSIWVWEIVFLILCVRNFLKWRADDA